MEKSARDYDREYVEAVQQGKKHQEQMYAETMKKGSYGAKLLAQAARNASNWAENDGLHPTLDVENRDRKYTVKQGLRAACVTREDAAATLVLTSTVLDNQLGIKRLLYVVIALLAYIAYKLS